MLKLLWKHMVMVIRDYRACKREMKEKGVSLIPILKMSEQDIRDPEWMFNDEHSQIGFDAIIEL